MRKSTRRTARSTEGARRRKSHPRLEGLELHQLAGGRRQREKEGLPAEALLSEGGKEREVQQRTKRRRIDIGGCILAFPRHQDVPGHDQHGEVDISLPSLKVLPPVFSCANTGPTKVRTKGGKRK